MPVNHKIEFYMSTADVTLSLPFTESEIDSMVTEAVIKVCDTMLSLPAEFIGIKNFTTAERRPAEAVPIDASGPIIASAVGFIGSVNGVLYLYFTDALAKDFACMFLGMDAEELEEEGPEVISDTLGELANMTSGTFKNQMCDKGFNCKLTIPSILKGQHFTIESTSSVLRKVYRFKAKETVFAVDLLMKPGE